jgi:hypothetical protein
MRYLIQEESDPVFREASADRPDVGGEEPGAGDEIAQPGESGDVFR